MAVLDVLFSNSYIPQSSPTRSFHMKLLSTDHVPVTLMTIKGTYYDKGYYYGLHFSKELKYVVEKSTRFMTKIGIGRNHTKISKEDVFKFSPGAFSKIPPHFIEELRGIIDGCKEANNPMEDERDIVIYMTFFELNEDACCSMYGIQPPDSRSNTYQLNNSEYPYPTGYYKHPICIMYYPQTATGESNGYPFFSIGYPCLMGTLTGINAHGLAFSQIRATFMKGGTSNEGIPYTYLIQEALRTCRTTQEAYHYFLDKPKTNAKFYVTSDPEKRPDSVQLWFTSPSFMHKYQPREMPDTSLITSEEFAFYEPLPNSVYWLDMYAPGCILGSENAYKAIKSRLGKVDDEEALAIAKDLGSRYLVLSAVYDVTNLKIWFSYSYKKIPAHLRQYHFIDLKELMNGESLS